MTETWGGTELPSVSKRTDLMRSYEVIRGELFVTPAPGTRHQRAVLELAVTLRDYVDRHGLGETIVGPFEVEFGEDTAVQPDVLVVLQDRAQQLTDQRLMGPPSLAIEVISYSRTDRLQKRELYLHEGVEEYWVLDPGQRRVERWQPGASEAEIVTGSLRWAPRAEVVPLHLDLAELFRKVCR
jgi:Uma2 family endonuclease